MNNDKEQKTKNGDTLEPSKSYKIVFSLYVAIGFLVLVFLPSIFDPMTYKALPDELKIKLSQPWSNPYVEPHPRLGLWVGLAAIPLFFMVFYNRFKKASCRGFYIFTIFTLFVCVFGFLSFGLDISFAIWGITFGFLMTMIDHFKLKKFDTTQLSDSNIEMWAKIEKIKGINDYWNMVQRGSFVLWGILLVVGCFVIVNFSNVYGNSHNASIPTFSMIINIIYPSLGIALGIIGTVLEHKNENNELMNKIKTQTPIIITKNEESKSTSVNETVEHKEGIKSDRLEIRTDESEKSYSDIPELEKNKLKYLIWLDENKAEFLIYGATQNIKKTGRKVLIKLLENCEEVVYFLKIAGYYGKSEEYRSLDQIRKEAHKRIEYLHDQTNGLLKRNILPVRGIGYKFIKTQPEFNFCIIYPKDLRHYKEIQTT